MVAYERGWLVEWGFDYPIPGFIEDAEPDSAHRVAVNRCCGGSLEGSHPYQVFYVSDIPFAEVADHYQREMEKRGFAMHASRFRTAGDPPYFFFEKAGWKHSFSIQEYRTDSYYARRLDAEQIDELEASPYAYIATYLYFNP